MIFYSSTLHRKLMESSNWETWTDHLKLNSNLKFVMRNSIKNENLSFFLDVTSVAIYLYFI